MLDDRLSEPNDAHETDRTEAAPDRPTVKARSRLRPMVLVPMAGAAVALVLLGIFSFDTVISQIKGLLPFGHAETDAKEKSAPVARAAADLFKPTDVHWRTLGVAPVAERTFRSKLITDGKIAIDEDHATPVFSPYAGRVLKLFAKPGDVVEAGAPLFTIEASDMVQGQNDFLAARTVLNKAKSQLAVAEIVLRRHRELIVGNAVAKRDLEQAEIGQVSAANDLKAAEVALEAARNRLRILGKTDAQIKAFEDGREAMGAETTVKAPISGTIVQRKVGPGQFIAGASNDPAFLIGDLSTVWLVANVRETDASRVEVGQPVEFTILADPVQVYATTIDYIPSSINSDMRRLQARGVVKNPGKRLRPEMFANVAVSIGTEKTSPAVPRSALIFEGATARVWVARPDGAIESRRIETGVVDGDVVQALSGLAAGERIITRGTLFIDRLAAPASENG